ncbi:MAG: transcriptional regulator NrdR [bacterium]
MKCPACHHFDTKVIDSRVATDGITIRRRRQCQKCSFRFSTREEMELLDLTVIKRDGRKEAYSREKLATGLRKALEKRPITADEFKKLVSNIEKDIQLKKKDEIKSSEIGEIVIKRLAKLDEVAYIRFASVYKSFKDVKTFQRELAKFTSKKVKKSKAAVRVKRKK